MKIAADKVTSLLGYLSTSGNSDTMVFSEASGEVALRPALETNLDADVSDFENLHVMGAPPAVVIVVRHGARLDASDKQWHLTSPTPYDPPLTYGGWTQSRALGARIATILRSREIDEHGLSPGDSVDDEKRSGNMRRRRHRVIIHTSPFLRCVQTSIAISSGLAQNPGSSRRNHPLSSSSAKPPSFFSSPRIRPALDTGSPRLAPISEPTSQLKAGDKGGDALFGIKKSTLRVDAFLGEWLTPDYFELITPPPSSVMMVASAKADLLRREDYSSLTQVRDSPTPSTLQGFPGGWQSPVVTAISDQDGPALPSMSALGQSLPRRDRTSSLSSAGSNGSRHSGNMVGKMPPTSSSQYGVYQPPVPSYAISSSEAIPPGFVAHARDSCVSVDYQWDSMREPQNWGTGGEYGEEWSSMHKRFRQGLQHLLQYYRDEGDSDKLATRLGATDLEKCQEKGDSDEGDVDLVVILVTHGAGCNALIGALTNQPVLLDVGLASLTMAVHRSTPMGNPASIPDGTSNSYSRYTSRALPISEEYEVKLVANTEHLRSSRNGTPTSSRAPSLAGIANSRQYGGVSHGSNSFVEPDRSRSLGTSSNFGSIRRATSAVSTPLSRTYTPAKSTSVGLWSAPKPSGEEAAEELDDMILNFGDEGARQAGAEKSKQTVAVEEQREEDDLPPLGGRLWGAPRPIGEVNIVREIAHKRRWTVNEPGIA